VDAVRPDRECDIDAPIHQDSHAAARIASAVSRGPRDFAGVREQRGAVELAFAHLHVVDTGCDGSADRGGEPRSNRGAVDDENQQGRPGRAQKFASPSSGLEALAYNRRGIRPAS
jgi:hypothetical protein